MNNENQSPLDMFLQKRQGVIDRAKKKIEDVITDQKFDRKDVVQALVAVSDQLNTDNELLKFIVNDLQVVSMRFQQMEVGLFSMQQATACATQTLIDKDIITKADMEATYNEKIKPALQEKMAAMEKQSTDLDGPPPTETVPEDVTPSDAPPADQS
jgi:septal ring factor EnvC (AmiA/AmiB activator)